MDFLKSVMISALGYDLTWLEFFAFITSVLGVALGVYGPRKTWYWWNLSSLLYALLFYQQKYYASALLQFIFIAGGVWGWFGWGKEGAKPEKLTKSNRALGIMTYLILWLALYPVLKHIGAAASISDAFGFVGSCMAQLLMIKEKYEAWPLWFIVDSVYTYQFWQGKNYLTSILYLIFVVIAVAGWRRWLRESGRTPQGD